MISSGQLKAICRVNAEETQAACISYFLGFLGGALEFSETARAFCLPPNELTPLKVVVTFLDYLDRTPGAAKKQAADALLFALRDEYPCLQ